MKFIDKFRHKTAGLTKEEIAKEAALMVKARLIHRYRNARLIFTSTEITDEKLHRAINLSPDQIFSHFRARQTPALFRGLRDIGRTGEIYGDYFPSSFEELIKQANDICQHRFTFLGHEHKYADDEINWHYDTIVDYEWPKVHYSQISIGQAKAGADIKIPWELARLQHFIPLGLAFQLTRDEHYAQEFSAQLHSFASNNPPEIGIHWLCAMEVALRAVSLSVAFYLFRGSSFLDEPTMKELLKQLLAHGEFIEGNLEFSHRITSNHYLSDLIGLLYIGLLFPEFKSSQRWADFALSELLKEMDKQIYRDGVDWEASIPYHAFVLEIYLYSFLLCKEVGVKIERSYWERLEKMFDFVRVYLKPDGSAPLIGDCDNGRVIIWQQRQPYDHAYLLSIAAVLFEQERFKVSGQSAEEALWLFGEPGWETFESLPLPDSTGSMAFPEGGIYVQREGPLYAIIDCGDVGINGQGSHSHNDLLSFEIFYRERTFLVDTGSYAYTGDPTARNQFRSTAYHNTVMIDGQEINEIYPGQLFVIGNQARPKVNNWHSTEEEDRLDAEHSGYLRLPSGIVHRREFYFNKLAGYWVITDHLTGSGEHQFDFYFNFDIGLNLEMAGDGRVIALDSESELALAVAPLEMTGMKVSMIERYVSKGYGHRAKSWAVVYNLTAPAPQTRRFLIAPCREDDLAGLDDQIAELKGEI